MFARNGCVLLTATLVAALSGLPAHAGPFSNIFGGRDARSGEPSYSRSRTERREYDSESYTDYRREYRRPAYRPTDPNYRQRDYEPDGYQYQAYRGPRVSGSAYSAAREGRRNVQRRLNQLGFNAGPADGLYGDLTRSAMAAFQARIGDRPTGRLTSEQVAVLYDQSGSGRLSYSAPRNSEQSSSNLDTDVSSSNQSTTALTADDLLAAEPAIDTPKETVTNVEDEEQLAVIPARVDPTITETVTPPAATVTSPLGPIVAPQGLPEKREIRQIRTERDRNKRTVNAADEESSDNRTVIAQQTAISPVPNIDDGFVNTLPQGAIPQPLPRAEPSADPFGNQKWRPKIFGMTVGDNLASVKKNLKDNGYSNCSDADSTMVCSSSNQSMSDKISIAFLADESEQPAYLVRRELSFKSPVNRAFLERQMAGRYPQLLADADGIVSSSASCKDVIGLAPGSGKSDALQTLFNKQKVRAAIDEATLDLLEACPDFYAVVFDGDEKVSNAEIVVFNSAAMRTKHIAALRQRRSERSRNGDGSVSGTLKF